MPPETVNFIPEDLRFFVNSAREFINKLFEKKLEKNELEKENTRLSKSLKSAEKTLRAFMKREKEDSVTISGLSFENSELKIKGSILTELTHRQDELIKKLQNKSNSETDLQNQISLLPEANQEQIMSAAREENSVKKLLALTELFKEISQEKNPEVKPAFFLIAQKLGFDSQLFES